MDHNTEGGIVMDHNTERIKQIFSDKEFVVSLLEAENVEAVQKMLADRGVAMTFGEIELMGEMLEALSGGDVTPEQIDKLANGGELSEDELEGAAGGNVITDFFTRSTEKFSYFVDGIEVTMEGFNAAQSSGMATSLQRVPVRVVSGGAVMAGIAAVAGIGYGIYDAVRRRW